MCRIDGIACHNARQNSRSDGWQRAIDIGGIPDRIGQGCRRDGQRARRVVHHVIRVGDQRSLRDGIGANIGPRCPCKRTSQYGARRIGQFIAGGGHRQHRIRLTVDLGRRTGHRQRCGGDGQSPRHNRLDAVVCGRRQSGTLADRIGASRDILTRHPGQGSGHIGTARAIGGIERPRPCQRRSDGFAVLDTGDREGQRRIGIAVHLGLVAERKHQRRWRHSDRSVGIAGGGKNIIAGIRPGQAGNGCGIGSDSGGRRQYDRVVLRIGDRDHRCHNIGTHNTGQRYRTRCRQRPVNAR